MNGPDSFQLLLNQMVRDLNDINEKLAFIGIYYISKITIKSFIKLIKGFKSYVIPLVFSNDKWLKSLGNWAIVTGCTNGIGFGYARELAKRQINLILIDENQSAVNKVSTFLAEHYRVEVITLAVDLSDLKSFDLIEKSVIARDIGILVNNTSAKSEPSYFHQLTKNKINKSIFCNINATTHLTRMILPSMVQKNKGAIVYISSSHSKLPTLYHSISGATDIFTEKLADSLRYEYSDKNIHFQCLNSAFLKSNLKVENEESFSNTDDLKFSSYAIKSLGWSKYTFGYWYIAFKYVVLDIIPVSLLNCVYSKAQKRNYIKHAHLSS